MKRLFKFTLLLLVFISQISVAQYNPVAWSPCHVFSFTCQYVYPFYSVADNNRIYLYENVRCTPSSPNNFFISFSNNDNATCSNSYSGPNDYIQKVIPTDTSIVFSLAYVGGAIFKRLASPYNVSQTLNMPGSWPYDFSASDRNIFLVYKKTQTMFFSSLINNVVNDDTLNYKNIMSATRVLFINDSTGYIVGKDTLNNNILIRSQDYGNSWNFIFNPLNLISDLKFKGDTGIAVGLQGIIYKTSDNGLNWNMIPGFTTKNFVSVSIGLNHIYAAGDSAIYHSIDSGNTWIQDSLPIIGNISWVKLTNSGDVYFQSGKQLYKKNVIFASINEFKSFNSNLSFYPNPTSDIINIQLKENTTFNVYIINSLGKVVLKSEKTTVDLTGISSGLYSVELKTTEGEIFRSKVVKID